MPTYAYRCTECSTAFDLQQSFEDDALTECPTCGGRLRKVYGSIGVTFSGSGFYRTDSRESASRESASRESASKSPAESGGSSSADSGSSGSAPASTPAPSPAPAAPAAAG